MDKVLEILKGIRSDIDFENTDAKLVTDRILASLDIISLVGELCDEFDITIKPSHLVNENFDSVEAIWNLVQELEDE